MANSSIQLSSLDFDTLKNNLKSYLSNQTIFKDYNFSGSNINVLLDVLSYNSYLNSFYLNMISSEMFMDSAQKLDSVVSHAKELNYVPRSSKSSEASLGFNVTGYGTTSPFIINKGSMFSGTNSNGNFTFVTDRDYAYTSSNNVYVIPELTVYEGKYTTDSFIYDVNNEAQRFILSNPNVDTDSIEVIVTESSVNTTFTKAETLYNLINTSSVYFLQAAQNSKYEIVFGDGNFGRIPNNLSTVTINYRITNGTDADGIISFICDEDLGVMNNGEATIDTINVTSNSSGGSNAESIDSIKFAAPRYFATQQRAVASDDYSSLVLSNFGGIISDVNVYGGELLEPKQYGRVVIALKPSGATIASDFVKNEISSYLKPYIALPNRIIITDPDYLYVKIDSTVQYNKNITTNSPVQLQTFILTAITEFSADHIETFGSDLRYSKIVAHIDNSDTSITSNDTGIKIIKRLSPKINYATSFSFSFNNPSNKEETYAGYVRRSLLSDEPTISSSPFTYVTSDGTNYPLSYIRDNNFGLLIVFTIINGVFTTLNDNLGTIDYVTGDVKINNLVTSSYGNYISLYMLPLNKDIVINNNKILIIDPNDVTITMIETLA